MVKRILALDIGDRRIGVAVSDLLGLTAQGVETIFTQGMEKDVKRVKELAAQYETDCILAGLPMRLSGEEGLQASHVREFTAKLREAGFQVMYQDERLTSVSAERVLIQAGVSREGRKKVVDKLAACYILQAFLDSGGWPREKIQDRSEPIRESEEEGEVFRLMEGYMDEDNIVELVDEDGNVVKFQHLMTLEFKGKSYVILAAAEETEDIAEDEAVVLRIDTDADGNDVYASVEDDDEVEAVFNRYLEIAEADEENDEGSEEDE